MSHHVALIGPEIEENLSLRYLAARLEAADVRCEILPFNGGADLPRVRQKLLGDPPFLVAISLAFQWRAKDALALVVGLREGGFSGHITGGGHFGTFVAEEILRDFPELDSICRFESEEILTELALAVKANAPLDIAGLARRDAPAAKRAPPDLAALPWPDRRGDPAHCLGHGIAAMVGSRGCYANCDFCCIAAWHQAQLGAGRYRLREVDDIADEMASLHHDLGREIFIFHDDNFFLPNKRESRTRIEALGDALEERKMGRFATVVKARPPDITEEIVAVMQNKLGCIRVFLGVESDAHQGLLTLGRKVTQRRNHEAMELLHRRGLYVCFNMLVFDPDTTFDALEHNLSFIEEHGHYPSNFGRVELYAGTPLLARMQSEGRARGDYLAWNYRLATDSMQETFELAMKCFFDRNFAAGALANRLQGTRFDVEVCRYFHPEVFRGEWLVEAQDLSTELAKDSARGMREIIQLVRQPHTTEKAEEMVARLTAELRACEARIVERATTLEKMVQRAAGSSCQHAREAVL